MFPYENLGNHYLMAITVTFCKLFGIGAQASRIN